MIGKGDADDRPTDGHGRPATALRTVTRSVAELWRQRISKEGGITGAFHRGRGVSR